MNKKQSRIIFWTSLVCTFAMLVCLLTIVFTSNVNFEIYHLVLSGVSGISIGVMFTVLPFTIFYKTREKRKVDNLLIFLSTIFSVILMGVLIAAGFCIESNVKIWHILLILIGGVCLGGLMSCWPINKFLMIKAKA
jgi:hypothetical protein